jgi:hypothetical protein
MAADLISIRVTIYLSPGGGAGSRPVQRGEEGRYRRGAGRYGREVGRSDLVYTPYPPLSMCN